ncbi:hypothetical protein DV515_00007488 [Chloebia gouldiae]|uniref:Methylated-DNA--protein-cysteine methyltransferase n=1 Tax=Chloebia gouldiae TaxID=44316 RepID=A0A3L8SJ93_CHLGU|nr:hypothetical protein DV515_00007488 [Chloebia gouldiae]
MELLLLKELWFPKTFRCIPPQPAKTEDSFTRQVLWTLLKDVKFGEAVSYKQLAHLAGNSRAARAVGAAMRSNPGGLQGCRWALFVLCQQRGCPVSLQAQCHTAAGFWSAAFPDSWKSQRPSAWEGPNPWSPACSTSPPGRGGPRPAVPLGLTLCSSRIPILIPCHRVIRSSGDSGSYGGGQLMKEWLLSHEKLQKEELARPGGR